MNKVNLDKGFWSIINDFNLDSIGRSDEKNGYKDSFPVSNIFSWYRNDENYCIKLKEDTTCLSCGFNNSEIIYLFPLIPITLKNMNFNTLTEILLIYFILHVNKNLSKKFISLILLFFLDLSDFDEEQLNNLNALKEK